MPGARNPEPEYIAARRVLLDALDALGKHRKALVLVGAQAIYLHAGEGDLAVSPYTTDGDHPLRLDSGLQLRLKYEAGATALASALVGLDQDRRAHHQLGRAWDPSLTPWSQLLRAALGPTWSMNSK